MTAPRIEHISDTALWVALYRAIETDRKDAHFRDPFARRLLGEGGEAIARSVPAFHSGLWPMVVRTCLFDELIERAVAGDGVDTIVNLAAGLDARPWRMTLPPALRWVDVDLPGILGHKTATLSGDRPVCAYEAVACDLQDGPARRALFDRIAAASRRVLILTEGLLVYLTPEEVGALAEDLHAPQTFVSWVIDLASPQLLRFLKRRWGNTLDEGRSPMLFGPAEGTEFFRRHGWKEAEYRSTWEEAKRLNRRMRGAWFFDLLSRFSSPARREASRRISGIVRLERI